jgi:hypothetical protein
MWLAKRGPNGRKTGLNVSKRKKIKARISNRNTLAGADLVKYNYFGWPPRRLSELMACVNFDVQSDGL